MNLCSLKDCGRTARTKGMCPAHYLRLLRGKPLDPPVGPHRPADPSKRPPCSVVGCYRPVKNKGICAAHYRRRDILKLEEWARPIKTYRRAGETHDVQARLSKACAEALTREAKAQGLDRSEWVRIILEARMKRSALEAA